MRTRNVSILILSITVALSACGKPDIETVEHWKPWLKESGRTLAVTKLLGLVNRYDESASKSWRMSERLEASDALVKDYESGKIDLEAFFKQQKTIGLNRDLFESLGLSPRSDALIKITELSTKEPSEAVAKAWVSAYKTHGAGKSTRYAKKAQEAESKATEIATQTVEPLVTAYESKNSQKVFLRAFLDLIGFHENRAAEARNRKDEAVAKQYDEGAKATARKLSPAFGQALKDYSEPDGARLAAATIIRFKLTADHVKTAEQIINDTSAPHTNVMSALDILVESPPDITAVPALVRILDQDPDKRPVVLAGLSAKILGKLKAQEAVEGLVNCLWRTDAYGRNATPECRVALTQLGPRATYDTLVQTLRRQNKAVEARATQYGFKDKGAVEAKVADLLGQLGNPAAAGILQEYLTLSDIPPGCERFLGEQDEKESLVRGKKTKEERCKAEQQEFLEDTYFSKKKEECVQLQADYVLGQTERFLQVTKALARLQADAALPKLIEFAKAEDSALQVRQAVVEQIAIMGSAKALPMLLGLLKDKDAFILPEGTELAKLGEESPNARSSSDRQAGRPGLVRAIHDYRQKILTTAVRITNLGKTKANDALTKEIKITTAKFKQFKAQNEKEIADFEAGRKEWDARGAQAYIDRYKASLAMRDYNTAKSRLTSYLVSQLAAKASNAASASEWAKKIADLEATTRKLYKPALEAKLLVKKNEFAAADKAAKRASKKDLKRLKAAYEKARQGVENYNNELNEVKKDKDRAVTLAKKEAEARFKRIPKDAHKWSAATNDELAAKAKSCSQSEETASKSVTYESCMAADDKSAKRKKKTAPKTKSQACKYVEIIQNSRPDEPSKKKKKAVEIPKLEKVKKDYDLKIAFRTRNVEYYERRLKNYEQLTKHLKLVTQRLPKKAMQNLSEVDISDKVAPDIAAKEAKMSKEDRKKAEGKRKFKQSLAIDDRLFVAYRLLNARKSKTNTATILKRLNEDDESVFQIYLQGASRHANKTNVGTLRDLQEQLVEQSKAGDDEKDRKKKKIRSLQLLPIIELAKQRSL